jgi:hypothetical protein
MNEVDAGRDRVTPEQVAIRRSTMSTRRRKGAGEVHEGQGAAGQKRTGARESKHTNTHTHLLRARSRDAQVMSISSACAFHGDVTTFSVACVAALGLQQEGVGINGCTCYRTAQMRAVVLHQQAVPI